MSNSVELWDDFMREIRQRREQGGPYEVRTVMPYSVGSTNTPRSHWVGSIASSDVGTITNFTMSSGTTLRSEDIMNWRIINTEPHERLQSVSEPQQGNRPYTHCKNCGSNVAPGKACPKCAGTYR